jgi:hypothetical protein
LVLKVRQVRLGLLVELARLVRLEQLGQLVSPAQLEVGQLA